MRQVDVIRVDGRDIKISHGLKLMYPNPPITKLQVVEYYTRVAKYVLPYIAERPLVMQRWPDGMTTEGFYQKEVPDYFPSWVKTVSVNLVKGGRQSLVVADSAAVLAYLASQATLTLHVWTSTTKSLKKPDRMIFDLDPSGKDFTKVIRAAKQLRKALQKRSYKPWVMTTGSRGLHVVVPIKPIRKFEAVRQEAESIARDVTEVNPDLTTEVRKNKRRGRIYVDVGRNSYGQTQVAPYSLRILPGAPIATPLDWSELGKGLSPQKYHLGNIFKRLF